MRIFARSALLGEDWVKDVRIALAGGRIASITRGARPAPDDHAVDVLLPALANLHSHAFQRAMAGMTEFRAAGRESFWTWRDLMYRFLDRLTPEQVEAIAALTYMEMLEAGYAAVGEFHYVHHQPGGRPYGRLSELSQRIFAATATAGIGLTHLPVLYTYAGVTQKPLAGGQLRFGNDVDRFARLVEECRAVLADLPADTGLGIAPHSLRATSPGDLAATLARHPSGPVHIHVAEQTKEVRDVEDRLGRRPVDWLLDNADVGPRWCLIHATHMTGDETARFARSGAVAGLCPITEANLGDGTFNGPTFLEHGGAFGIGSDSNVRISLTEELRMLEYSQRLRDQARNVLVVGEGSVGRQLYSGAATGGALALGRDAGTIRDGALADLVAIDGTDPALCGLTDHQLLDGVCFAASDRVVTDVWSAGRHMVRDGRHVSREPIVARYRSALSDLLAGL
ncbi:8-oxoguanine deaminase [Defluviimonas aquaemixtae]|uniref:8-oxoguanine deaminase n=1 Tax=Albidovulum aquaemixtae TaxID=1542388 RepID=A0A2R8B4H1_9RHOB|nr:formimidoylglutamate deiminase [Defluviimonas aquaemixtae]SPH17504.1 8-oxoguanine deaminase [Defluviimonas aquaemixtae]